MILSSLPEFTQCRANRCLVYTLDIQPRADLCHVMADWPHQDKRGHLRGSIKRSRLDQALAKAGQAVKGGTIFFQWLFHNPGKSRSALSRKIFWRSFFRPGWAVVISTLASEAPR